MCGGSSAETMGMYTDLTAPKCPPYPYVDPVSVLCSYSDVTVGPGDGKDIDVSSTSTYFCSDATYRVPARWTSR